nr:nuclear transport factor 2 family protein [uncultured Flavobacterium sp.]
MTQIEQILQCEKKLTEAMKTNDTKALDELLYDNLVFIIPTGQLITKAMDMENYRLGRMKISEIVAEDPIINTIDDISTVTVTIHLKGKYDGQKIDGKYKYLRVWKLFDNSLKVIAGSSCIAQLN